MKKSASFPSVRATPELKDQVQDACDHLGVKFSMVVNNLLEQWVTGRTQLDLELDPKFVAEAKAALESEETQALFEQVGKRHKKQAFHDAVEM
jgi:antitoxin component of RelBE/YafQ-DinJ toxin-antitoxin module